MRFSPLYIASCEWVIKFTAYRFSDGAAKTEYLSNRYWKPGELYSGNPIIYPMLTESPGTIEAMGRVFSEATDQTVTVLGKSSFKEHNISFFDDFRDYELENAKLEFYVYLKPTGAVASTANTLQLTGRCRGYSWNGDNLQLAVRRTMLTEKEFAVSLASTELDGFYSIEDDWADQPLPLVFGTGASGQGQIVDVAKQGILTGTIFNTVSAILSTRVNGHEVGAVGGIYVQNQYQDVSPRQWLRANLGITNGIASAMRRTDSGPATGTRSLKTYEFGVIIDQSQDFLLRHVSFKVQVASTPAAGDSNLDVRLYHVLSESFGTSSLVLGKMLQSLSVGTNKFSNIVTNNVEAFFFAGLPAGKYLATFTLSNPNAVTDVTISYKSTASTAGRHWRKTKSTDRDAAFQPVTEFLEFEAAALVTANLNLEQRTIGSKYYTRDTCLVDLRDHSGSHPVAAGEPAHASTYKFAVSGIKDDVSGTYTGTPSSTIRLASDIIRFLLGHSSFLNIPSGDINSTSFSDTRTAHANAFLYLSFVLDGRFKIVDRIGEILDQSDTVLYRTRDEKIKIKYLSYVDINKRNVYQSLEQDELELTTEYESEAADLVNDVKVYYGRDEVNTTTVRQLSIGGNSRLTRTYELSASTSTEQDSYRQDLASDSEACYGNLPLRANLDLHPFASQGVLKIARRLFDRSYKKRKKVQIKLPLKRWLNAEFFDTVFINLNLLSASGDFELSWYDSGSKVNFYRAGLPIKWIRRGSHQGEIKQIEKTDQEVVITVEEMLPF